MLFKKCMSIISFLGLVLFFDALASGHSHSLKANVQFLATSTAVHTGVGTSQDVYLVIITMRRSNEAILARLVDEFPPYRTVLSSEVLTSADGSSLKIRRDATCDRAFRQIPLRTAPGDPIGILPERLGFHPSVLDRLGPEAVLPCYRTER